MNTVYIRLTGENTFILAYNILIVSREQLNNGVYPKLTFRQVASGQNLPSVLGLQFDLRSSLNKLTLHPHCVSVLRTVRMVM